MRKVVSIDMRCNWRRIGMQEGLLLFVGEKLAIFISST